MSQHDWLAIDAGTAPMVRAHELRFAWERFVGDLVSGRDDEDDNPEVLREALVASWRRSYAAGVAPTGGRLAAGPGGADETRGRWEAHPLGTAAPLIHECLSAIADEA